MGYLVIDLGTTSIKTSLITREGSVKAFSLQEYTLDTPSESIVELDAKLYWKYVTAGIRELLAHPDVTPRDVESVSISSQAETLIVLDKQANPLIPAIVWLDTRSGKEAEELEQAIGVGRTGLTEMTATWPATKILWLKRHKPQVFAAADKFLMLEDYILYLLTGEFVGEYTLYSTSALFNSEEKTWWKEMLDYLEIGPEHLSSLRNSGEIIGPVLPQVATTLGLNRDTQVVTGAMDQIAGMVGAANISEEIITETTGGAFVVCKTLEQMPGHTIAGSSVQCHAVEGKYLVIGWCAAGGLSYTWLRDTFFAEQGKDKEDLFKEMDSLAASVDIGSQGLLFYPFLAGPGTYALDQSAKGCFYGIELHHTKAHFARSVMESIAFLLRETLERMGSGTEACREIRTMGGGAKSPLWNSMKADAAGLPVKTLQQPETASLGVAILSAAALGHYRSIEEGVNALVSTKETYTPDPEHRKAYDNAYRRFLETEHRIYAKQPSGNSP